MTVKDTIHELRKASAERRQLVPDQAEPPIIKTLGIICPLGLRECPGDECARYTRCMGGDVR